jgi:hypothetical protein
MEEIAGVEDRDYASEAAEFRESFARAARHLDEETLKYAMLRAAGYSDAAAAAQLGLELADVEALRKRMARQAAKIIGEFLN